MKVIDFPDVIISSPSPQATQLEEILYTNVKSCCMNEEIVDETIQDLDMYSPERKTIKQAP